jgi:hypothetical protein
MWTGFIQLRIVTVAAICEHGNEPSGHTKTGEFLGYFSNEKPLKNN